MASAIDTTTPIEQVQESQDRQILLEKFITGLGLHPDDLRYLPDVSPYLILDGHRTGIEDHETNPERGYVEGAVFSMRFARIFQELGGKKATFLIHTLRNYQTMDRMAAIFDAIGDIGKKFIECAVENDIRLRYFGHEVHGKYAIAKIINMAEMTTSDCRDFELNFLTNYSEDWGSVNKSLIEDLPEITVIGRFTKGHYSGAGIPGHANKANFVYIQQASVSENWTDKEIMVLILTLLKSHLALNGFVGGKSYTNDERTDIRIKREIELFEERYILTSKPKKQVLSFSPMGPITVFF